MEEGVDPRVVFGRYMKGPAAPEQRVRLEQTYAQDAIHNAWEAVYRDDPVQRAFNDKTMDRLAAYFRQGPEGTIIDAGCGVGDHSMRLAQRGFETLGLDLSEQVLGQARARAEQLGLADKTTFRQASLEQLDLPDASVAGVHFRGVLMHIPDWESALSELCRVLKPGGRIVVIENNTTSVESAIVRTVRLIRKGESELRKTRGGLEFWMEREGQPFVWRIQNMAALREHLQTHGVDQVARFATEFWDLNRFGEGWKRSMAIRWNRLYWRLRLPAFFSHGNAVVGVKRSEG